MSSNDFIFISNALEQHGNRQTGRTSALIAWARSCDGLIVTKSADFAKALGHINGVKAISLTEFLNAHCYIRTPFMFDHYLYADILFNAGKEIIALNKRIKELEEKSNDSGN